MATLLKFVRNEDGATAIEYGLVASLISVAAVIAMGILGNALSDLFNTASDKLN